MKQWHIPAALCLAAVLVAVLLGLELLRGPLTVALGKPRDLPDTPLYDEHGHLVPLNAASGRWLLLFPGFTHCPDICPTTLSRLATVADRLAPVQVILFSVDPERDTPHRLRDYVTHFHPSFGARVPASPEHLGPAAAALGIAYRKVTLGHTYTMDHTTAMPLLGPDGRVVAFFAEFGDPELLIRDIRQVIEDHEAAKPEQDPHSLTAHAPN